MERRRRCARLGIAALAALIALVAPNVASAQITTHNVNTTADGGDAICQPAPGACTLRDAVADAAAGDTISVPAGNYVLSQQFGGELLLDVNMTFAGAGARQTVISGGGTSRVFYVAGGAQVAMSGVTVTAGNGDGADVDGLGGAVYVDLGASLGLTNSAVTQSAAPQGGGIYTQGFLGLAGTTVSGNQAIGPAGGPAGGGGGIYHASNSDPPRILQIIASTISGNNTNGSGGGVASTGTVVSIQRSTIAGNTAATGAGLFKTGSGTGIEDTIIAATAGESCAGPGVASFTGSHNLSDDASCGFTEPADKQNLDPLLGPLQDNGGPTNTMALLAGSPAIGGANPAACGGTDQRGVARPQQGTCDIGAFEYVPPAPPPPPPPPPPPDDVLPPPVVGKSVNVLVKSGTVRIKLPGKGKRFRRLLVGEQVPVGTTIDTTKGRVTLVAAANKQGKTATSDFYGGIFKVTQKNAARPITNLKLVEKLSCPKAGKATIAAKRKKKRRLWGDGSGRFRTEGNNSSATVRGTKWLVEDRCTSTLTRVVRGSVTVRDFVKKKTIIVRRGKRYIARAR